MVELRSLGVGLLAARRAVPWLAAALAFGVLAYLTRPEGMLLPAALAMTTLITALRRASAPDAAVHTCPCRHGGRASLPGRSLYRREGGPGHEARESLA